MIEAENLYQDGIAALKANRRAEAQQLLRQSLAINPRNADGWLYLAQTTDDRQRQLKCVENALKANPAHPTAIKRQRELKAEDDFAALLNDAGPAPTPVPFVDLQHQPKPSAPPAKASLPARATAEDEGQIKLGRLRLMTGPTRRSQLVIAVVAGTALVMAMINTFLAPYLLYQEQRGSNFSSLLIALTGYTGRLDLSPDLFTSLLLVAGAVGLLAWALIRQSGKIAFYDQGFVILRSGREQVYWWNDVTDVSLDENLFIIGNVVGILLAFAFLGLLGGVLIFIYVATSGSWYQMRLYDGDQRLLQLDRGFISFRQAGKIIEERTLQHLLPDAVHELEANEVLKYGEVKVTRSGISRGQGSVNWQQLRRWKAEDGWLRIYRGDQQVLHQKLNGVRNAHVLVALCKELGGRGL